MPRLLPCRPALPDSDRRPSSNGPNGQAALRVRTVLRGMPRTVVVMAAAMGVVWVPTHVNAASAAEHVVGTSVERTAMPPGSGTVRSAPPAAAPRGELRLTLTGSGRDMSWTRGLVLQCPDGGAGRHPEAERACAELAGANGDLPHLPRSTEPCTREYAPVTAAAEGHWRGQQVSWKGRYPTLCALQRATGAVFRF